MRLRFLIVLLLVGSPALCFAQALSDRVPADAVAYLGWRGADDLGAGYDQSHLKALLDASQLAALMNDSLPKFLTKISAANPDLSAPVAALLNIGGPLFHHPTALFLLPMDKANPKQLMPRAALLCDAGGDAPSLAQHLKDVIASAGEDQDFKVQALDHLVVLSTFSYSLPTEALSKNKDFLDAMGKMPKDPVTALYIDGTASVTMMNEMIDLTAPPEMKTSWPKVREELGLAGMKKVVWAEGFEGKNWVQEVFIDAPAPRSGLLAMMDSKTVSDAAMKLIPSTSTMAAAAVFDVAAGFKALHDGVSGLGPDAANGFDQGLQQVNQMAGIDIEKDLLANLGAEWVFYTDPATAGTGGFGFVTASRVRNGDALAAALGKLETNVNEMIQSQMGHNGVSIALGFKHTAINGVDIHYFNSPLITPAYAIKDGVMFIAMYPQMVASAITAPKDGKSILDNVAYLSLRKRLGGPQEVTAVAFSDLQRTAPDSYQSLLMLSRLYVGIGDIFGLDGPPLLLPSLDKITPELEPAGQITWTDAAGFHARGLTPFPGSQILSAAGGIDAMWMGEMSFVFGSYASFGMRATSSAHTETVQEVGNAANLRQIGMGCLLYTNENKGAFPPDLGTIFNSEDVPATAMLNPDLGHKLPDNWATLSKEDQSKWVNENSDYVYVGAGLKQGAEPGVVVAHEKIDPNGNGEINILFADGHVESQARDQAKKTIEQSKKLRDNPQ